MSERLLQIPELHQNQRTIRDAATRYNVTSNGRRWGKTMLGEDAAIETALDGGLVGWFAPTYKYVTEVWRDLCRLLNPVIVSSSKVDLRMELITGGVIEIWTLTDPNAGRSRKYQRAIIDEAAMVPNLMATWNAAIRPTLMDYGGDAWFLSTPKGHNAFWTMYQWGLDETMADWSCWQMPTSSNPYIPADEIEAMRNSLPERIFAQEVMAVFLDDAGGVFRGVIAAATAIERDEPEAGHQYIIGVDWGKITDFTVLTVLDTTTKTVVKVDRFNRIDYAVQVGRLKALSETFHPDRVIAEQNSMGEPLVEQLQREGLPVQGFQTTNASKAGIIEALALAFERREIRIPNDPVLVGELQAYEMERLRGGSFRYNAPEGLHDDTVMSLALAWHGIGSWLFNF